MDIQQKGRLGESEEQNTQTGYALTLPGQAITQVPDYLIMPGERQEWLPASVLVTVMCHCVCSLVCWVYDFAVLLRCGG